MSGFYLLLILALKFLRPFTLLGLLKSVLSSFFLLSSLLLKDGLDLLPSSAIHRFFYMFSFGLLFLYYHLVNKHRLYRTMVTEQS